MIKLNVKGQHTFCAGYEYSGTASFEGKTVKEVLEEIKDFSKTAKCHYLGEGFGNPNSDGCDYWGIMINRTRYLGNWNGWKNEYDHSLDDKKVEEVLVNGGWYCWYDFRIICEN